MSGVIVDRRDQVLITGGRCPPERAFSTAFTMPLSMNGPFFTERAMFLHFQLPIADCRFQIGNWQLQIGNYLVLRSFRIIFCVRLLLRVL
jgi:hypothetical protein